MFDSEYISCPQRGFEHTLEMVTKEFNAINGAPQWDVHYPTPEQPTISERDFDEYLDEIAQEIEDEFDAAQGQFEDEDQRMLAADPDHIIHRPDDDPADLDDEDDDEDREHFDELVAEDDGLYDTLREYGEMYEKHMRPEIS